jgi:hypothetical protein
LFATFLGVSGDFIFLVACVVSGLVFLSASVMFGVGTRSTTRDWW